MTDMAGRSISGYMSMARLLSEKAPRIITMMKISTVEIGFLTALSYIFISCRFPC